MSLLGLQRDGTGPVVVWLHGFTQTRDSGHEFLSILAGTNEVLTIDLPGHGSNAASVASLEETADLLAAALPEGPFTLGGYSYGGRVALHFALAHPKRLTRLVVLSATMGIEDEGERATRRERDEALAAHVEAIGTDRFLEEWLAQPMFAALPVDARERRARSSDATGLANSLRHAGTGTQAFLRGRLVDLDVPTTIIAGTNDTKFVAEARRLHETIPHARLAFVEDAGHAAHLERPASVAAIVRS
jgi:2-succinyl-6-hydroxy-2,4-cyclohexadiene-1-carboxylate synthase